MSLLGVSLISGVLVLWIMMRMVGGVGEVLTIANDIRADSPLVFVGFVLFGVLIVGYLVFSIGGFIHQLRRAFDEEVHTVVTETNVQVTRTGGRRRQSSGVTIPFEAVTAVQYLDPERSSTRLEFGDVRSEQFFAGRSTDWVRIERANEPAVYLGSDRPFEVAEMIARSAPAVEFAEPY